MTRKECMLLIPLFYIVPGILASAIRKEKEINSIQIEKEKVNLFAFVSDDCVHKTLWSIQNNILRTSDFSKVTEYKVNREKNNYFYTIGDQF